jgi:hypothetical protein
MELLPAEDFVLISIVDYIRTSFLTPHSTSTFVIMDPPDEDHLLPPPSYYEQEFDTKISQATDLSLQSSRREAQLVIDEDGWPRYDPTLFEDESIPSMKGKEYPATSFPSAESSSGVKKRPLPDISSIKPNTNVGPSNIPQTAPLHIAKKSISKSQEAALETRDTASQFASNPLQPDPSLTLENSQNNTTRSVSNHQTVDVPLYSLGYSGGVPDKTGGTPIFEQHARQHARQPDSPSEGTEETESSDTLMPEPLNVNTSTGQWDGYHRSVGDLKYPAVQYPAVQYLPHRQSMPPQNLSRIGLPELQRSQPASYVPTFSQPPYEPLVSFNPNMAYGASSMAAGPPSTIRQRQPTHKISFPLQYDPHALYKYVFQLNYDFEIGLICF